jgi:uncharacterized protein YecT (DUF1311 family)
LQTAVTDYEINRCAADKAQEADRQLNASYRAALCYVGPEEKKAFLTAQRAWLAYRDADCRLQGNGGGTLASMNHALCVASLSQQRAKELDVWPPNADRSAYVSHCAK